MPGRMIRLEMARRDPCVVDMVSVLYSSGIGVGRRGFGQLCFSVTIGIIIAGPQPP